MQGGRHPHDAGDVVRPRPPFALLRAANEQRVELQRRSAWYPLAQRQGTDALGAAELVSADAHHVGAGSQLGDIGPWGRLDCVGVQHRGRRLPAHEAAHLGEGLQRPNLVVDQLD